MRNRIVKSLTIAVASVMLLTSVTAPVKPTTTIEAEAATKVITIEEAAKKIVDTTNKACAKKKKLTVTFAVECSYSNSGKVKSKIRDAVEKRLAGGYKDSYLAGYLAVRFCGYEEYCKFLSNWKNGKLVCKYTVKGKSSKLSEYLFYLGCGKRNLEELKSVTKGMKQKQKAWRVAVWLMADHGTYYSDKGIVYNSTYDRVEGALSEYAVNFGGAHGLSDELAEMYCHYASAVGVKNLGIVKAKDYCINCIKIGNEIFYFDMQSAASRHEEWVQKQNPYIENEETTDNVLWTDVMEDEDESDDWWTGYVELETVDEDECVDSASGVKGTKDTIDRYFKVSTGFYGTENNDDDSLNLISEEDYCMYSKSAAKNHYKDLMGNMKKWKYKWIKYK